MAQLRAAPSRTTRSHYRKYLLLAALCLLGCLLRAGFIAWLVHLVTPARLWNSGTEVVSIANALNRGQGFSSPFVVATGATAWVAPLYPLLVAAGFRLLGSASLASLTTLLALNLLCDAVVTVAIYLIGERYFNTTAGWLAAVLWTCALEPIAMASKVWDSNLSVLLATAALAFSLHLLTGNVRTRDWVGYGILWAVVALTSPSLLALMPIPMLALLLRRRRNGLHALLAFAILLCLLMPWSGRNYLQFHRMVPVRGNFGAELWYGNRPGPRLPGDENSNPAASADELKLYQQLGEADYVASRQKQAIVTIHHNPKRFAKLTLARIAYFWGITQSGSWLLPAVSTLAFIGLAGLARSNPVLAAPFASALLLYPLPYYLTHADWSYRYPIEPVVFLLAADVIAGTWDQLGKQGARTGPIAK